MISPVMSKTHLTPQKYGMVIYKAARNVVGGGGYPALSAAEVLILATRVDKESKFITP